MPTARRSYTRYLLAAQLGIYLFIVDHAVLCFDDWFGDETTAR